MKIYTRTGDAGRTALLGGERVPKTHPRVAAYGAVDELNAFLGRALGSVTVDRSRERLGRIQHDLFALGAHLATPPAREGRRRTELPSLPEGRIGDMEAWMDEADGVLPSLRAFILPGGSPGARELHVCRTVCRRAERASVVLAGGDREDAGGGDPAPAFAVRYLNRLSDLLFVLARLENHSTGAADVTWQKEEE